MARALHGPRVDWGDKEELLAATVEQLQVISSLLHHAWFKPPHPEPVPIPRPGQPAQQASPNGHTEPPKMSSKAEIRAFFGGDGTKVMVSSSVANPSGNHGEPRQP